MLVLGILIVAALISTIPLVDSLKDSFVDRFDLDQQYFNINNTNNI